MGFYIKSLLHYHVRRASTIASEVAQCENIDPDLVLLIVKNKSFFLVESQLLIKSRPLHLDEDVDAAGRIVNEELLPLWRKVRDLPEDHAAAMGFLNIMRHFFYARIDPENINYEFLHALAVETDDVLDKIMDMHGSSRSLEGSATSNS
jgi:hypothetical protein